MPYADPSLPRLSRVAVRFIISALSGRAVTAVTRVWRYMARFRVRELFVS